VDRDYINKKRILQYTSQRLTNALKGFVGKVNSKEVMNEIQATLKRLDDEAVITKSFKEPKVSILWEKWKFRQKFKWFIANKLFEWLGNETRQAIDNANIKPIEYDSLEAHENAPYPDWAITTPKSIIVTDIFIRPITSIEFITIDLVIGGKDE